MKRSELKQIIKEMTQELLEETKSSNTELGDFIYHQTGLDNAYQIISEGFKTGKELNKGETTESIFFSPTPAGQKGTTYSRSSNKNTGMVEVSLNGLKLIRTSDLPLDESLPSFEQEWYKMKEAGEDGKIPKGFDGIVYDGSGIGYDGKPNKTITEIILTKDAANRNLTGRILNSKGLEIK